MPTIQPHTSIASLYRAAASLLRSRHHILYRSLSTAPQPTFCSSTTLQPHSPSPSSLRPPRPRVCVGLSGGVDSAVTAYLLCAAGWDVLAVFMRNWDVREEERDVALLRSEGAGDSARSLRRLQPSCDSDADLIIARGVAAQLGVKFTIVSFSKEYWNSVFTPFLSEYAAGATPNPDVLCNAHIKFKLFRRYALEVLGATAVATGHYAAVYPPIDNLNPTAALPVEHAEEGSAPPQLLSSASRLKDQSDFISRVARSDLKRVMFPLATVAFKSSVRALAVAAALPAATAPESMGMCFIGKRTLPHFLSQYIPLSPAPCVDLDCKAVVGTAPAWQAVTIGQGARISGAPVKWIIAGKCPPSSAGGQATLHVVRDRWHAALFTRDLIAKLQDVVWSGGAPPPLLQALIETYKEGGSHTGRRSWMRVKFKLRHRQNDFIPARITVARARDVPVTALQVSLLNASSGDDLVLHLHTDAPQRASAVGQTMSIYSCARVCAMTQEGEGVKGVIVEDGEVGPAWEDAGRVCIAGAPLAAVGATLWEQGLPSPVHAGHAYRE